MMPCWVKLQLTDFQRTIFTWSPPELSQIRARVCLMTPSWKQTRWHSNANCFGGNVGSWLQIAHEMSFFGGDFKVQKIIQTLRPGSHEAYGARHVAHLHPSCSSLPARRVMLLRASGGVQTSVHMSGGGSCKCDLMVYLQPVTAHNSHTHTRTQACTCTIMMNSVLVFFAVRKLISLV